MNRIHTDTSLLLINSLVLPLGILAVSTALGSINYQQISACLILVASWWLVQAGLGRAGYEGDPLFYPIAALLSSIGLIFTLRLKPELYYVQLLWCSVGAVLFLIPVWWRSRISLLVHYKYIAGILGLLLLLSTLLFGTEIGGNKNWILLGSLRFQPSEFAKLLIVLYLAAYLSEHWEVLSYATRKWGPFPLPHIRFAAPFLIVWMMAMMVLVLQRDLGAALLYFGTVIGMVFIASGQEAYVAYASGFFLIGSLLVYRLFPHVRTRLDIWLNPWADPNGAGYQTVQSLFALGSGGMIGSGISFGYPGFIPEVHTDFIFAAIGEELGLVGTGCILLLYIILIYRALRNSIYINGDRNSDSEMIFRSILGSGLALFFGLQTIIIIGGVVSLLPLTGVTLPFVSYGGSSMVSNYILLGTLAALSSPREQ